MQRNSTDELAERYGLQASVYRDCWAPVLLPGGRRLLAALADARARRVLDLGTGVGALLGDVRATFPGASVFAFDRSPGMLALAPADVARAVADATAVPLAAESVDVALLVFFLFHLERPLEGLREARRVLRSGGRVGTLTWEGEFESRASQAWAACLDDHGAPEPDPATLARHEPLDSPEKVAALLREAGFDGVRAWREELVGAVELEQLMRLKVGFGNTRTRLDLLDAHVRERCIAEARRRLEALLPADFVMRGGIVFAVAGVG